jgi:mono/diheme cytochrome c family protein
MKTWLIRTLMVMAVLALGAAGSRADDVAALYKAKCAVCHGADGKGDTPAGKKLGVKDFHSPDVAKMSDAELFEITKKGKDKMPGYDGKITDNQIKELVQYVRSLK